MPQTRTQFRFTVADYQEMIKYGILTEQDHVELIRGEILTKMSIGERHISCVLKLNHLLNRLFGDRVLVSVQSPIRLSDSVPEPDIALLVSREDFYSSRHPNSTDVLLVIEVSDSSLDFDREIKGPLYAEAGIPEYWIVNVTDGCLEVHRQPQADGRYHDMQVFRPGQTLELPGFAGLTLAIADVV